MHNVVHHQSKVPGIHNNVVCLIHSRNNLEELDVFILQFSPNIGSIYIQKLLFLHSSESDRFA